jgi:hypothetical protein
MQLDSGPLDSSHSPDEDIQQAVQSSQAQPETNPGNLPPPGEVIAKTHACPLLGLRYAISQCAWMAEKYPWQTTAALLMATGCAWICSYFGITVLAGLVLYAVFAEH